MGLIIIYLFVKITSRQNESPEVSVKVKPQSKTYSKYITLNTSEQAVPSLTPRVSPISTRLPTLISTTITNTLPTSILTKSPTPTEIIVTHVTNTPEATDTSSLALKQTPSPTSTKTSQLPISGVVEWS